METYAADSLLIRLCSEPGAGMLSHLHRKIVQKFTTRAPAITLLYCTVILLFLGWLDITTGDYSLIAFYLIPVSLAAWFVSKRCGLLLCLLTVVVRGFADKESSSLIPSHSVMHYWNEFIELLFLVVMCLLFSALKKNLENRERAGTTGSVGRYPEAALVLRSGRA